MKGVPSPRSIGVQVSILVGSVGGFITSGIIGLFIGTVVLTLGYNLFVARLSGASEPAQAQDASTG
jgi:predicted PurR-regulated permease PerM